MNLEHVREVLQGVRGYYVKSSCFICFLYFSFLQNFTRFWFLGDTQGARFYDMHGTALHLFVILFSAQYMEKRFALETRERMTT